MWAWIGQEVGEGMEKRWLGVTSEEGPAEKQLVWESGVKKWGLRGCLGPSRAMERMNVWWGQKWKLTGDGQWQSNWQWAGSGNNGTHRAMPWKKTKEEKDVDIGEGPWNEVMQSAESQETWRCPSCQEKGACRCSRQRERWAVGTTTCVCPKLLSRVQHFATPWTVVCQAPLSMGLSRQEYRSGLPCPTPRDLPHPGVKPASLRSPEWAGGFFTTSATWEVPKNYYYVQKNVDALDGTIFPQRVHSLLTDRAGLYLPRLE